MTKAKVHLYRGGGGTACRVTIDERTLFTTDERKVTCARCRRRTVRAAIARATKGDR